MTLKNDSVQREVTYLDAVAFILSAMFLGICGVIGFLMILLTLYDQNPLAAGFTFVAIVAAIKHMVSIFYIQYNILYSENNS